MNACCRTAYKNVNAIVRKNNYEIYIHNHKENSELRSKVTLTFFTFYSVAETKNRI